MLPALILIQILHIPTNALLRIFLTFSSELREFCRFYDSIPNESYFSIFKRDFKENIADLFNSMVLKVLNICDKINLLLPEKLLYKDINIMLIYDTSGLKQKVKETNFKTLVSEVNKQKACAKATDKKWYNAYTAAYKNILKY